MDFRFQKLELKDAYLIDNYYLGDNRGSFTKTFEKDIYMMAGIRFQVNEIFTSLSMKNVIRGLHFQTHNPQAKIVSVVAGSAWDVIVDLRTGSPTYMKWIAHELSAQNHLSFFVPRGFAHGFASLEDHTIMLYQCDGEYDSETDAGIIFNDSELGIEWPIEEKVSIHSDRDLKLPSFSHYKDKPIFSNSYGARL